MNTTPPLPTPPQAHPQHQQALQHQFGLRVAAHLSHGTQALPHDVSERLRAAREQALARRKQPQAQTQSQPQTVWAPQGRGSAPSLGGGPGLWHWAGALAFGLLAAVGLMQLPPASSPRMADFARLDAALLTDDLPLEAYTDPGFAQFLQATTRPASPH